jgi:Domain of unknown function (DUF4160)
MPTIAIFYGIIIRMYWDDHNPPHFHASYGAAKAIYRIMDGRRMAGELPATAERLVQDWAILRRVELEENWRRAIDHQALLKIAGPDQE